MFTILKSLTHAVYWLNKIIGRGLSWLTGLMAITVFFIVVVRELFAFGAIDINLGFASVTLTLVALQESVTYMHALVFMLCLAYTAQEDGHVRVDIFYSRQTRVNKAWVDALGAVLFLLPFSLFLVFISWRFTLESWRIFESSINPGGIPAVFLLKSLLPAAGILLALRGLGDVILKLLVVSMRDDEELDDSVGRDNHTHPDHTTSAT